MNRELQDQELKNVVGGAEENGFSHYFLCCDANHAAFYQKAGGTGVPNGCGREWPVAVYQEGTAFPSCPHCGHNLYVIYEGQG